MQRLLGTAPSKFDMLGTKERHVLTALGLEYLESGHEINYKKIAELAQIQPEHYVKRHVSLARKQLGIEPESPHIAPKVPKKRAPGDDLKGTKRRKQRYARPDSDPEEELDLDQIPTLSTESSIKERPADNQDGGTTGVTERKLLFEKEAEGTSFPPHGVGSSLEEIPIRLEDEPQPREEQSLTDIEMKSEIDKEPLLEEEQQFSPIVFDIFEDVPAYLEEYVRLGRLGCFAEATEVFALNLFQHVDWFPVAAENAEVLYRQGDFESLLRFVNESLELELKEVERTRHFTEEERCTLLLFRDIAGLSRRVRPFGETSLENTLEALKKAAEYPSYFRLQGLSEIQAKILAMLFRVSNCDKAGHVQLSEGLLDTLFNFSHKDIRKAEDLIRAKVHGTGTLQLSIAAIERNLFHHFESSGPPDMVLSVAQLSTAVAFCETYPLWKCNVEEDRAAYKRMRAEANTLQFLLKHHDQSFSGSGLEIRLALLDLDEGIISGMPKSHCLLMMRQFLTKAINNNDLRLQREIRGRISLLTSPTLSVLDSPPCFPDSVVASYSTLPSNDLVGVRGSVLKSLIHEALDCFDALQLGMPTTVVLKILLARMRLWRWAESLDLVSSEVLDKNFSDDDEDIPQIAYNAEDIAYLERITERFGTPRVIQHSALGSQETPHISSLYEIANHVLHNMVTALSLCRSAGNIIYSREIQSEKLVLKKPIPQVDFLLLDISRTLGCLENSHSSARSRREGIAQEHIDIIASQDIRLLLFLKKVAACEDTWDEELADAVEAEL